MQKTGLIQLLGTFTRDEMREFGEFVQSSFYNKNETLVRLFEALKKYHPDFSSNKLSREKIFNVLFPNETFKDQKLRELGSKLLALAEHFIVAKKSRDDEVKHMQLLNDELIARHFAAAGKFDLLKLINKNLRKSDQALQGIREDVERFHLEKYIFQLSEFTYRHTLFENYAERVPKHIDLTQPMNHLTEYFVTKTMLSYALLCSYRNIYNYPFDGKWMEAAVELLYHEIENPSISIIGIHHLFELLRTGEEKHYFSLKEFYMANIQNLGELERRDIGIYLENYAMAKERDGNEDFTRCKLEIYKFELEHEVFFKLEYAEHI